MSTITNYVYEIPADQAGVPSTSTTSGDASGGLPGPLTVVGIEDQPITGPGTAAGQLLYFNGTSWAPVAAIGEGTHAARPAAAPGNTNWLYFETDTGNTYISNGSSWTLIASASGASPLTTKGDLWGYSTTNARVPVGADGTFLGADSSAALGVSWQLSTVWHPVMVADLDGTHWNVLVDGDGNAIMTS